MAEKSLILLKQENLELSKENQALKETVTKLLEEITRLRDFNLPIQSPQKGHPTPELKIIEEQIRSFEIMSASRVLDIDEIRALDILIKNKRLLEEKKPIEPEWKDVSEKTSTNELLELAGNVESEKPRKRNKPKASQEDPLA